MRVTMDNGVTITLTEEQLQEIAKQTQVENTCEMWKPTDGENAWFTDFGGNTLNSATWRSALDKKIIAMGNVFKTEQEAKDHAELQRATYRLKREIYRLNKGDCGFKQDDDNYVIYMTKGILKFDCYQSIISTHSWLHLRKKEGVESLLRTHEQDLRTYFNAK